MSVITLPEPPAYRVAISRYALDRKIPYGDPFWPKLNASFDNRTLGSLDLAAAIYDGHPFTTWQRNHWRIIANYECGQHLAIDMDTEDARSTLSVLAKDAFTAKYGAFVYTTPSHTPEKPRARVVFLLDTPIMQAANYALAAQALVWLFGTADRQCTDAVRFFYGSRNCDFEIMDNVLPLAKVKELITQYQESGKRERKRQQWTGAPAEMREVADALDRIDPWGIDYGDWVQVIMALHAEYGDAGLSLAEHWGQGDKDEIARKWKSFKQNGNGAGAVTIATVFGLAKRFGWRKVA